MPERHDRALTIQNFWSDLRTVPVGCEDELCGMNCWRSWGGACKEGTIVLFLWKYVNI